MTTSDCENVSGKVKVVTGILSILPQIKKFTLGYFQMQIYHPNFIA
jgi:hypothetical protein